MDLELKCDLDEFENVRFSRRGTRGLVVAVKRSNEDSNILLSDKDVERLYEYLGEHLGKDKESVPEVSTKITEEVPEHIEMSFKCIYESADTLTARINYEDEELNIKVNTSCGDWCDDAGSADVYLSPEDALTMAENIIKAFGSVGIEAEPVVEEYEAASKADLDKVVEDLKDLKEEFHNDMIEVAIDWNQLNKDLNQVHVEISQIQNDLFNANERNKVKWESLGKHIEGVSKEVVAAMETLAGKVDYNFNEIHSIKSENIIRKINEDPSNVKV